MNLGEICSDYFLNLLRWAVGGVFYVDLKMWGIVSVDILMFHSPCFPGINPMLPF